MLKQDSSLKKLQQGLGKLFAVIPLSPNHWTVLSLLAALAGGAMIAYNQLFTGLIFFAVAGALDVIDGAVARVRGETTKLGGFLDGVSDRFVEAIFLFSFMFYPLPIIIIDPRIWLAAVIFLGTCMPSFIRAYADHKEVISKNKALALGGICERSERLLIILIGLAAGITMSLDYFIYALILAAFLSLITILQRLLQVKNNLL